MLPGWIVLTTALAYIGALFAIAQAANRRADQGRSVIANPYVYALSLGVYATAWTFYGSVGRAAANGVGFLPIYLGPTLLMALWWVLLRKIVRISKTGRITSLADFVSTRYGKSALIAGLVTVIAVVGVLPYVALQLKAIAHSYTIIVQPAQGAVPAAASITADVAFWTAGLLAVFTILFGTRHLDAAERHEGLVAAVAVESVVKLVAFLAVGVFVTWGLHGGPTDIFARAAADARLAPLFAPLGGPGGGYASWTWLILLSMLAFLFLPRQFQVAVVENVDEAHLRKAVWLFPLYMLAINLFVVPVAFGGLLHFGTQPVDPDTFVLTLPLAAGQEALAVLVFLGGLSAATGMVIVETTALSTMVCNDLVMPILLRIPALRIAERRDVTRLLLGIRRGAIVTVILLGYVYYRVAGEAHALVSIGLISFAAVAQFGPATIGALYWRGGTRAGALAGLSAGFGVWLYTLLLPSFAKSGWLPFAFVEAGPLGIGWLRPHALFGLGGLDDITHAMLWSMAANIGAYVAVSVLSRQSLAEQAQAARFVDALRREGAGPDRQLWKGTATVADVSGLLARFLGAAAAGSALAAYARRRGYASPEAMPADAAFVQFAETALAGAIGGASARIVVASAVKEEALSFDEVRSMLDEASQVIAYSHELEQKSQALQRATEELTAANRRLQELDRLKDDFVSTVTHELRTPLTSIRAFSEILRDNPELDVAERERFLGIVINESERLTRLINQVLDLAKLESGRADWQVAAVDLAAVIRHAVEATEQLFRGRGIELALELPDAQPTVLADHDRLQQVLLNLLSNAAKFAPERTGRVVVAMAVEAGRARVSVTDNGPGIRPEDQALIFEKFRQAGSTLTDRPQGTGLGLPISRQIVEHLGGSLGVASEPGKGATFHFELPVAPPEAAA